MHAEPSARSSTFICQSIVSLIMACCAILLEEFPLAVVVAAVQLAEEITGESCDE